MSRRIVCILLIASLAGALRAEQVEMKNGDRYAGKIISVTAQTVVLQSDVLGKVVLPRDKVASITLTGPKPQATATAPIPTNHPPVSANLTNGSADISAALRGLGANTNFIDQVRKQFLTDAGPEANNKYDGMVADLFNGKMDINGLRAEAKSAADQIRALKQQGGDVGGTLDSYLAILDNFVRESAPAPTPAPAAAAPVTNHPSIIITR